MKKLIIITVVIYFCIIQSLSASNQLKSEKPPPENYNNVLKILIGVLGGTLLSVGSFYGVKSASKSEDLGALALFISIPFGSALGVYAVGNASGQKGSFGATLVGSYMGGCAGCMVFGIGSLVGAPIGATIEYNNSHKRSLLTPKTGFINYSDGKISFAIPSIYYEIQAHDRMTLSQNVNVVKISF